MVDVISESDRALSLAPDLTRAFLKLCNVALPLLPRASPGDHCNHSASIASSQLFGALLSSRGLA